MRAVGSRKPGRGVFRDLLARCTLPGPFPAGPPHDGRPVGVPIGQSANPGPGMPPMGNVSRPISTSGGDPRPGDTTVRVDSSRQAVEPPGDLPGAFARTGSRAGVIHATPLAQYGRFRLGSVSGLTGRLREAVISGDAYRYLVVDPDNRHQFGARRIAQAPLYDRMVAPKPSTYVAPTYGPGGGIPSKPTYMIRKGG